MNLRQVRKKIKTINNVAKITKAMQMVAAVKMKKAQQQAAEGRLYRKILDEMTQRVMKTSDVNLMLQSFIEKKSVAKEANNLYIVVASSKGLCGSFNVNLFRFLLNETNFSKDDFIVLGRKASAFLSKTSGRIIADFSHHKPIIDAVSPIFSLIFKNFSDNTYQKILLIYNKFISTFQTTPYKTQLLPFADLDFAKSEIISTKTKTDDYLIEPSHKKMIEALFQDYLKEKIKTAILDSEAGEHAARMFAMKNATDSAEDINYNLTLLRNKLRQQSITYELLDMVAAKESTEIN